MEKDSKKDALKRLKIIEGHLKKVIQMIEEEKYCIDILQQSSAVQSALRKVDEIILNQHLRKCAAEAIKKGQREKEKAIKELLRVFHLAKNNDRNSTNSY